MSGFVALASFTAQRSEKDADLGNPQIQIDDFPRSPPYFFGMEALTPTITFFPSTTQSVSLFP
jgi:hypothetical protein